MKGPAGLPCDETRPREPQRPGAAPGPDPARLPARGSGERPRSPPRRRQARAGGTSQSRRRPGPAPAHLVRVVDQPGDEVRDPAAVLVLVRRAAAPTAAGKRAPGRGGAQPPAHSDGAGPARQRRSGRRRRVQPVLAERGPRQQREDKKEEEAGAVGPARKAVRSCSRPLHRRRMPTPPTPAARRPPTPAGAAPHPRARARRSLDTRSRASPPHRPAACPSSPARSSLARVASSFGGPGFGCQDAGLIGWNVAETAEVIPRLARVSLRGLTSRVSRSFPAAHEAAGSVHPTPRGSLGHPQLGLR